MKSGVAKKSKWWKTTLFVLASVIWVFSSVVVAQFALGYLFIGVLGAETFGKPIWSGVYNLLVYLSVVLLSVYVLPKFFKKWRTSREELGLTDLPTWTDIGLAPVGYIVSTLLAAGLTAIFNLIPWFNAEEVQNTGFSLYMNSGERIIAFIVLVVIAPVMEEVIFRGWLYGKLRSRVNVVMAILITSVLFGVMHFQWNVGVNVFAFSVIACGLREVTGTVYAGALAHMVKNGVAFYLLYVLGI